jgi:hypothetical protein
MDDALSLKINVLHKLVIGNGVKQSSLSEPRF